jgi:hypothetical protein
VFDSLEFILGLPGINDYSEDGSCSDMNYTTKESCEGAGELQGNDPEVAPGECECSNDNFLIYNSCLFAGHDWLCSIIWTPSSEKYGTFISIPKYKIEDFNLTYIDDPLYTSHSIY